MKKLTFVLGLSALLLTSCGQAALKPEVLLPVAQALETANKSEEFVAPTKATITMDQKFDMAYPGEEPTSSTGTGTLRYDAAAGYFSSVTSVDGEVSEVYSYVKDGTYYLAMAEGEEKMYAAVPLGSDEAALAMATAMSGEMNFGGLVATQAKGLSELQSVIGFCEQITLNTDSDPENDIDNGYTDKYELTLTGSASENNMDVTLKLTGRVSVEEEGYSESGSVDGTLKVKFKNGYLTYSLDETTLVESATIEGETMEMRVYSKLETTISYGDVSYVYPDLTDGYVEMPLA